MTPRPDLTGLLASLDEHGVSFVVGSVGATAHGAPGPPPGDLDIVPATDSANLRRLADALAAIGAEASAVTGAWWNDEHGEQAWVEDGIERTPGPLDPAVPESFDHSYATRYGRLDAVTRVA